ncbi:MAG: hypothetical protein WC428_06690 [Candidatus Paceibacterota bacterium]
MADFILPNGDEVTFDLDKLTFGEWQDLRSPVFARKKEVEILCKITGLPEKVITSLTMNEAKKFYNALVEKAMRPVDPN